MNIVHCLQGTPEWLEARCGNATASHAIDWMARLKGGGETADRRNYKVQLVAETLTGLAAESYVSPEMKWGIENEPYARACYETRNGVFVDQVGFVLHPTIERAGASPDGLLGKDGLLEIKCPKTATHLRWILDGVAPAEHVDQMQFQMACTGREWCEFVSYDPRLTARYQLFTVRVPRDEARISELNDGVRLFLREMDAMIAALGERMPEMPKESAPANDLGGLGLTEDDFANLT